MIDFKMPWGMGAESDDEDIQIVTNDGMHLATVSQYPLMEFARLIKDAPILLNALQRLLGCAELNMDHLEPETRRDISYALEIIVPIEQESKE